MTDQQAVQDHLRQLVANNDVVLFMKGTMQFPQCGFSAQVSQIMQLTGIEPEQVNVLEDMGIREGIKEFSNGIENSDPDTVARISKLVFKGISEGKSHKEYVELISNALSKENDTKPAESVDNKEASPERTGEKIKELDDDGLEAIDVQPKQLQTPEGRKAFLESTGITICKG